MHGLPPPSAITYAAQTTVQAYARGAFPMADEHDAIHWHWPLRRAVLPLHQFHVPRRLQRTLRNTPLTISYNRAFLEVLLACAAPMPDRCTTWINSWIRDVFVHLHNLGLAHSIEIWRGSELVGGLYGLAIAGFFAGESMFHRERDASKIALVHLATDLRATGFSLFDVQYATPHLQQFGVVEVSRQRYHTLLERALHARPAVAPWSPLNNPQP